MSTTEYLSHDPHWESPLGVLSPEASPADSPAARHRPGVAYWSPEWLPFGQALWSRLPRAEGGQALALRTLGLTSSAPREGVSTIALHLALAAAAAGEHTLLVDANAEHAGLAELFGHAPDPGLADLDRDAARWPELVRATHVPNLALLPAGQTSRLAQFDAAELTRLLERLRNRFGLVILDLPPAVLGGQTLRWSGALDGLILVIEAERSRCDVLQQTRQWLLDARARLLGAVLNKRRAPLPHWIDQRL